MSCHIINAINNNNKKKVKPISNRTVSVCLYKREHRTVYTLSEKKLRYYMEPQQSGNRPLTRLTEKIFALITISRLPQPRCFCFPGLPKHAKKTTLFHQEHHSYKGTDKFKKINTNIICSLHS